MNILFAMNIHVGFNIIRFFLWLGGYDKEEKAARAYDLAALKYWGPTTTTNFPVLINLKH